MRLSDGQTLALNDPWWAWNHPEIQLVFDAAHCAYYIPIIDSCLKKNLQAGRRPSDWDHFADLLGRDPGNPRKWEHGYYKAKEQLLFGISSVLGVDMHELYPSNRRRIAEMTWQLCNDAVPFDTCQVYADYRLQSSATVSDALDQQVIRRLAHNPQVKKDCSHPATVESVILRVSRILGPILERIKSELDSSELTDRSRRRNAKLQAIVQWFSARREASGGYDRTA